MNSVDSISSAAIDAASQLHRSALRLFRLVRAARPEKGLGLAGFSALARLQRGGVTTATALAAYLRIQPQSVTRLLADLERDGLIERRPNEQDRRQSLIEITPAGTQALSEEVRVQEQVLAQCVAESLTPAEQELLRLAAGLMERVVDDAEARIADSDVAPPDRGKQGRSPRQ